MRTTFDRRRFALLLAGACSAALLAAPTVRAQQEKPKVGWVRLVNAIGPGTGNTRLTIDGENMYPKGYKLGQRTGGIGMAVGPRKIVVSKDGVEEGTTTLNVEDGETVSLIAFAEKAPADKDKPERWVTKLLRLKQRDVENGYRLTVISVTQEGETLFSYQRESDPKQIPTSVKRLMTTSIDLGRAAPVSVFLRNQEAAAAAFKPDAKGNYVVVLYEDTEGNVKAVAYFDPKFVIAG
jgi:hypothetical protein